jgi:cytochrome c
MKYLVSAAAAAVGITSGIAGTAQVSNAAPPTPSGETVFRQRCAMCHSNVAGKTTPLGPNLVGVAGRKAGSTAFKHSPAMKASGIVWNANNLDRYLASPTKTVPGSKMTVAISDAEQRAALVRYLGTLK